MKHRMDNCDDALNRESRARLALTLIAGFALACLALLPISASAEIVVIVNVGNGASLDDEAIARIYLAQVRKFPDGSAAQPIDQKDGAVREDFTNKLVKRAPAHIKSYWAQQKFTGNLKSLKQIADDDAVVKFVAENADSIGYVDAAKVRPGVKVVAKF